VAVVRLLAVLQVRLVLTAALVRDLIGRDDPALDLVEPQLAAELDPLTGLEPADDLSVGLEEREQLVRGRDRFPVEGPAGRLLDALNQQGQQGTDPLGQAPGCGLGLARQDLRERRQQHDRHPRWRQSRRDGYQFRHQH
jgi:hypothetical protein